MNRFFAILSLLASFICSLAAQAQDAPLNTPDASGIPPVGNPIACDAYYPDSLRKAGVGGVTVLSVHVLSDGTLHDISLLRSSGNSTLDSGALRCAATEKTAPPTSDGQPIDVQWQAAVLWVPHWHAYVSVPIPSICPINHFYPAKAIRNNEQGAVTVKFQIGPDGTPINLAIDQSSGYADLDQAAEDCIKSVPYPPATANGQPVAIDKKFRIHWRLH